LLLSGCASGGNDIVALFRSVQRDSAAYCSESQYGCEYHFKKLQSGWLVTASLIFYAGNERAYPMGEERGYFYDQRGRLLDKKPGM